jgi:predicted transposase YbfD/YdcC
LPRRFPLWIEQSAEGRPPASAAHWLVRDLAERGGQLSTAVQCAPKVRHGRWEARRLWALHDPEINAYLDWPHLAQICRLERWRSRVRQAQVDKTAYEVTYLITSARPERADATALLATNRGHWGIENQTHHVRDVTLDEDRSQVRSGAAPQAFAACKNLALALLRRQRVTNVAEALRTHAGRPKVAIALVASSGAT